MTRNNADFQKGAKHIATDDYVGYLPYGSGESLSKKPVLKSLPIDSLMSTQPYVVESTVNNMMEDAHFDEPIMAIEHEDGDGYYIYDGHHRVHAAKSAGLTHIPALVYPHWSK